ncbi:50S ribosomal subunit protein L21 [uncultured Desulfobacterium sp.]|uniref:Large ribosomal subunit protein bL21 n=1 Tax=uncultured Desulfobacterium sp. TaxID=201089 RepID=A0A445N1G1_9BACT|nr:50S ribosomal subunit protein L21 [uncultured Desulfobacterium sp.]
MYAVIKTGGKQYRVNPGEEVKIEKLPGEVGDPVNFSQVLLAADGENVKVGKPYLDGAKVTGSITRHGSGKKVVVLKYKRRKGFRKNVGHRQHFTQIRIEDIII